MKNQAATIAVTAAAEAINRSFTTITITENEYEVERHNSWKAAMAYANEEAAWESTVQVEVEELVNGQRGRKERVNGQFASFN